MEESELIKLIDRYLDEALKPSELEDLNDLLENSREFRDLFRQRVQMHADLSSHYEAEEVEIIPFQKPQVKKSHGEIIFVIDIVLLSFLELLEMRFPTSIIVHAENGAQIV